MPGRCRAPVAGATGYIGMQCVAMLARHPNVELTRLLGRSHAGRRFRDVVPGSGIDLPLQAGHEVDGADAVLTPLPHPSAAPPPRPWTAAGPVWVAMTPASPLHDPAHSNPSQAL